MRSRTRVIASAGGAMALGALLAAVVALPSGAGVTTGDCHGVPVTLTINDDGNPIGPGDDTVFGATGGNDVINGEGGDDYITSGDGRDRICGGAGRDHLEGEPGRDVVFGDEGDDGGSQSFHYGPRLVGGAADDVVHGGSGEDLLRGNPGGDRLKGEDGDDILDGGQGRDVCVGGTGHDRSADAQACEVSHGVP